MEPELRDEVVEFVKDVLTHMGLSMEVEHEATPEGLRLGVAGDGSETLLRRRGKRSTHCSMSSTPRSADACPTGIRS